MSETWEVRRSMRWGSQVAATKASEAEATAFAVADIDAHGNVGRIQIIDQEKRVVYYDVYEDEP